MRLLLDATEARVQIRSRWMGQDPLAVELQCTHHHLDDLFGVLELIAAKSISEDPAPYTLPPSDGPVLLEYVRLPTPQKGVVAGSDTMYAAGAWNTTFSLLLWLHPDATFDTGRDLPPEEYDEPVEQFLPVSKGLLWLEQPSKLEIEG
ncbi:MAG: hypothetical protein AAFV53_24130 [Myxococcota bacterium]